MKPSRALPTLLLPLLLVLGACDFLNGGEPVPLQAVITTDHPSGTLVAPATVTFDSRDSRGRIARREWRVNGEFEAPTAISQVEFENPGTYEVTLTVFDSEGEEDTESIEYHVMSLAESYGADYVITPDEFDGFYLDFEPTGIWRIEHESAWLKVQPESGHSGPVRVTFTVIPELLPEADSAPKASLNYYDFGSEQDTDIDIVMVALLSQLVTPQAVSVPNARMGAETSASFTLRNTGAYPISVTMSLRPSVENGIVLRLPQTEAVIDPTGHPRLFDLHVVCPPERESRLEGKLHISTDDPRGWTYNVPIEVECREAAAQEFQIELVFKEGDFTPKQIAMMEAAARRWEQIVVGDIPSTADLRPSEHESCLEVISGGDAIAKELKEVHHIDDLLVYVRVTSEGMHPNTLARGGPCRFPSMPYRLPNHGRVMINPAYLDEMTERDYLTDTMIHELGHALGVGTLWEYQDLIHPNVKGCELPKGTIPTFHGGRANTEYTALGGSGDLPTWTDCSHWHKDTFGNESMSPTIVLTPDGVHSPVSIVTVASLADLGYVVDYGAADAYVLPGALQPQSMSHGEVRHHGAPVIDFASP